MDKFVTRGRISNLPMNEKIIFTKNNKATGH